MKFLSMKITFSPQMTFFFPIFSWVIGLYTIPCMEFSLMIFFWANLSFSCMKLRFSCMKYSLGVMGVYLITEDEYLFL